jgi:hypothetical protein
VFRSSLVSLSGAFPSTVSINLLAMPNSLSTQYSLSTRFECPNCAARYELVRVEAPREPTTDHEISCLSCDGPLHGREGPFLLKYFLIERPNRRAGRRKVAPEVIS